MMYLQCFLSLVIVLLVYAHLSKERLIRYQKKLDLRTSAKTVLEDDIKRIWITFYESYLYVYSNSKTTPTDKEFLDFRDTFVLMFRRIIGNKQCYIYDEIFGGAVHFDLYLKRDFEKAFKEVFIESIAKAMFKDE